MLFFSSFKRKKKGKLVPPQTKVRTVPGSIPVVSLGIFYVVPSNKTMCPEINSASENEYQGFLLG